MQDLAEQVLRPLSHNSDTFDPPQVFVCRAAQVSICLFSYHPAPLFTGEPNFSSLVGQKKQEQNTTQHSNLHLKSSIQQRFMADLRRAHCIIFLSNSREVNQAVTQPGNHLMSSSLINMGMLEDTGCHNVSGMLHQHVFQAKTQNATQ